jgi:hypothetical protein
MRRGSMRDINGNLRWGSVGKGFFCFCQKKIIMTTWDGELLELLLEIDFSSILQDLFFIKVMDFFLSIVDEKFA